MPAECPPSRSTKVGASDAKLYFAKLLFVLISALVCALSIHQQFPVCAGMVPQHFPENLVSGAALPHSHDQHASCWSVLLLCSTHNSSLFFYSVHLPDFSCIFIFFWGWMILGFLQSNFITAGQKSKSHFQFPHLSLNFLAFSLPWIHLHIFVLYLHLFTSIHCNGHSQ